MRISDESAREFMQLYEAEFGEQISLDEAYEMGDRLVSLYEILSRPLPHEKTSEPQAPSVDEPLPLF